MSDYQNKFDSSWIGSLPDGWKLSPIGIEFRTRNVKVNDTDYPPLSVTKQGILPQLDNVAKSDANNDRKQVLKGDFVINSRSDRKQSCGISPLDGSVSLINTVLVKREGSELDESYVKYALNNCGFAEEFYRWGHGIVADLWTTRWSEMKSIELPIPPSETQRKIGLFLSDKESEIELLIHNEQKQIENLKKYKQIIITKIVTKGLDTDVPTVDCGISWFGKIPNNWILRSIKSFCEVVAGATPDSNNPSYFDGDIPWITPADFKTEDKYVSGGKRNITRDGLESCSTSIVPEGSVIFSKRAPIGTVAIAKNDLCTNQGCLSCVPYDGVNSDFLYYSLSVFTAQFELFGAGTTFKEISAANFKSFKIPFPPIDDQNKIAEYLNSKCSKINALIASKQKKIDLLNSYRKSLVYEYVTGKKEVR